MEDSILNEIKLMLGLEADNTPFDSEIIAYINSALFELSQLGIGPEEGFVVTGSEEVWSDYINEFSKFTAVKTFIKLKVQLKFDPPSSSSAMEAMKAAADELGWRLNLESELSDGGF